MLRIDNQRKLLRVYSTTTALCVIVSRSSQTSTRRVHAPRTLRTFYPLLTPTTLTSPHPALSLHRFILAAYLCARLRPTQYSRLQTLQCLLDA